MSEKQSHLRAALVSGQGAEGTPLQRVELKEDANAAMQAMPIAGALDSMNYKWYKDMLSTEDWNFLMSTDTGFVDALHLYKHKYHENPELTRAAYGSGVPGVLKMMKESQVATRILNQLLSFSNPKVVGAKFGEYANAKQSTLVWDDDDEELNENAAVRPMGGGGRRHA